MEPEQLAALRKFCRDEAAFEELQKALLSIESEHWQPEEARQKILLREQLIKAIAKQLRQSLDLEEGLNATVTQLRQFLECDRVIIFRFEPNGTGVVAAESVGRGWPSLAETIIQKSWLKGNLAAYRQGDNRFVTDVQKTPFLPPHVVKHLEQRQVKATLTIPILLGEEEFSGILAAHQCSGPRHWQPFEVDLLKQLAIQIASAIGQAKLYDQLKQLNSDLERQVQERTAQLQEALDFEATLKRITDKVRDNLDEAQILQTVVRELTLALKAKGCDTALYDLEQKTSTICHEYLASEEIKPCVLGSVVNMADFEEGYSQLLQGQYFQYCPTDSDFFQNQASIFACPIFDNGGVLGDLWLFNFKEWVLSEVEIRLVQQVASQCAIAIRQSRLYQAAQAQVEELERLHHLKDDFLNTVSHELRAPIANMKMAIHLLQVVADPEQQERYLKILKDECDREAELINDLLDLQRLEAETASIPLEPIDLQNWIPGLVEPFRFRMAERQQHLEVSCATDLPIVISNRTSLARILTELLNNACNHTPVGGEVSLEITHLSRSVMTKQNTVRDTTDSAASTIVFAVCNQAEIPATELSRIFEEFYRVPNADRRRQGGTGLGLALVKKLVKQLQGTIHVESGAGQTTFTVELPN